MWVKNVNEIHSQQDYSKFVSNRSKVIQVTFLYKYHQINMLET